VWPLYDGRFHLTNPPGVPEPNSPEYPVHGEYFHPDGTWLMDIGAFLVRTGDRLLLIDAGAGPSDGAIYRPPPAATIADVDPGVVRYFRSMGATDDDALLARLQVLAGTNIQHGQLGTSLARYGFRPADVTDVVLTHLHHDHIGWVSRDGTPYFPNATVRCERRDADFFLAPDHDDSFYVWMSNATPTGQKLAPVLDRLELWDGDANIAPGVDVRFAPGHTPGSCLVVLSGGTERALILGDTVHCPLEITDPDFSVLADMDQQLADRTREMIRRELADGTTPAAAPHFAGLRFGRVVPGTGRAGWTVDANAPSREA